MLDAMLPLRLAQAASELAMRNTMLAMSFWTSGGAQPWAMGAAPKAEPEQVSSSTRTVRSWYRHPDQPAVPPGLAAFAQPGFNPFAVALQPWMAMMKAGGAGSCMMPAMPAAAMAASPLGMMPWQAPMMQAWMKMWGQLPSGMTTGPTALALMAFGMPHAAARSTAEAGALAMEASRKAAEGMEQMLTSYRSSGGHATAQIIFAGRKLH